MRTVRAVPLALLLFVSSANAQGAYLVKDIDSRTNVAHSSSPAGFVQSGPFVYFRATMPETGQELFRTDGTSVSLVADTLPGEASGIATSELSTADFFGVFDPEAVDLGGTLLFTGSNGRGGRTLWSATATSASPLADIYPGGDAVVRKLTVAGSRAFFLAEGSSGTSLWETDGTAGGTRAVARVTPPGCDISQDTGFCYDSDLVAGPSGSLFFTQRDEEGPAIYEASGEPVRLRRVLSSEDGRAASLLGLTPVGDRLFFSRSPGLWVTDSSGTRKLAPSALHPFALGELLVFHTEDGSLWATDGTAAGTRSLGIGGVSSIVGPVGKRLLLITSSATATDLLATDGTWGGTHWLAPLAPGVSPALANTRGGAYLFFQSTSGSQITWTDGTREGTRLVTRGPACPHRCQFGAAPLGDGTVFTGCDDVRGCEPWTTDGTASGTRLVRDLDPGAAAGSAPGLLANAGGTLFFTASDAEHGREIWTSDGTDAGTHRVSDLTASASFFDPFVTVGRTAYMQLGNGDLWRADASGAALYATSVSSVSGSGDALWFAQADSPPASGTRSLWAATGKGLFRLMTLGRYETATAVPASVPGTFHLFVGSTLWRTDGTTSGTAPVVRLPGAIGFAPVERDGNLTFGVFASETRTWILYTSDGTPAGTHPLAPDGFAYDGALLPTSRGVLVSDGISLWSVAGGHATPLATVSAYALTPSPGLVFFIGFTRETGSELWRTDGTPAGTRPAADLAPGPLSSNPSNLVPLPDGRVVFSAETQETGRALWVSDGTPQGTRLVADVRPGPASGVTSGPVLSGGLLYFGADDGTTGSELWAIPLSALPCGREPCRVVSSSGDGTSLRR